MPSYVSVNGKFYPAHEEVQLPLTPEDIAQGKSGIYKGPDRAAVEELKKNGVDFFGMEATSDPDLVRRAISLGFKDVAEYLSIWGVDPDENKRKQEEKLKIKVTHTQKRKPAIREGSGDFGLPKEMQ